MKVPRLVFQLYDEEHGVEEVEPDQKHVFRGDFDHHQLSTAEPKNVDDDDADVVDNESERNIFSISDIFSNNSDDGEPPRRSIYDPVGSVGRLPNDDGDEAGDDAVDSYNICPISKLQDDEEDEDDNVFALPSPSRDIIVDNHQQNKDANDILPSITDIQALNYAVSKDTTREPATAEIDLRLPLEPLQDADGDENGGLWFKGHIMPDQDEVIVV